jgi:pimeloyl-ACP methyl ester carboxylesterase
MTAMREDPTAAEIPIRGGLIEALSLPGGPGGPLLVLGGVETGLRPLTGTEQVLQRRWEGRTARRPVLILGRPIPDDPADAGRLLHPRVIADAVADALAGPGVAGLLGLPQPPFAIEAESGCGRISMWLTVEHPELVSRLVLVSVSSETPFDSRMAPRMAQWIELAERDEWSRFFGLMAIQMRPASGEAGDGRDGGAEAFEVASRLQPKPATPERFIGELKATLEPSSFVTDRLREIAVPTLVIAAERDQVVPIASVRQVAEGIPGARLVVDPDGGHTVRTSFPGYDELVEAFLAEGD